MKKIDAEIISKEEAYWRDIKEKTEREIETLEKMLKFNKGIKEMAIQKIKSEKKKFKP